VRYHTRFFKKPVKKTELSQRTQDRRFGQQTMTRRINFSAQRQRLLGAGGGGGGVSSMRIGAVVLGVTSLMLHVHHHLADADADGKSTSYARPINISSIAKCEESTVSSTSTSAAKSSSDSSRISQTAQTQKDHQTKERLFHGMFPERQLWKPKVPYPLWDDNWNKNNTEKGRDEDNRGGVASDSKSASETAEAVENIRHKDNKPKTSPKHKKPKVTRHVLLIRHGQYDETYKEDEKRVLTPLGEEQAHLTGQRLAEMVKHLNSNHDQQQHVNARTGEEEENHSAKSNNNKKKVCVRLLCVSDMTRAKQTADIIASHIVLPATGTDVGAGGSLPRQLPPDKLLNEGLPAHPIPQRFFPPVVKTVDEDHPRIEQAFQKYICNSPIITTIDSDEHESSSDAIHEHEHDHEHQFDIIVCHGNAIRYFFCRALQLPPEAWLRMSIFNCSLTYLMIKSDNKVACRMLGDIGHLKYEHSTFSMSQGFAWE
jgi:serine/threonine-protein phosphatase PGAM5